MHTESVNNAIRCKCGQLGFHIAIANGDYDIKGTINHLSDKVPHLLYTILEMCHERIRDVDSCPSCVHKGG